MAGVDRTRQQFPSRQYRYPYAVPEARLQADEPADPREMLRFIAGRDAAPVPLDVVATMGADILIGIDLTGRERDGEDWGKDTTPNMIGTLTRTINVAYNTSASRTLPLAHVLVRPTLRPAAVYDVRVMDEFIAEGERATYAALSELQKVLKWL